MELLFCGDEYGIIYDLRGVLYQSKLQDIDLIHCEWKFKEITASDIWKNLQNQHLHFSRLRKVYLPNDTIFAMEKPYASLGLPMSGPRSNKLKCGIFDLKQKKWNEISHFENKNDSYAHCACYDEYKGNIIYVVGDNGDISEYDLANDQWNYQVKRIKTKLNLNRNRVCWMDNEYSLCCSDGKWFGNTDIREQDDWNENLDAVESASPIIGTRPQWGYRIFL